MHLFNSHHSDRDAYRGTCVQLRVIGTSAYLPIAVTVFLRIDAVWGRKPFIRVLLGASYLVRQCIRVITDDC